MMGITLRKNVAHSQQQMTIGRHLNARFLLATGVCSYSIKSPTQELTVFSRFQHLIAAMSAEEKYRR